MTIFAFCVLVPPFVAIYACKHRNKWDEEYFSNNVGAYFEGTKSTRKGISTVLMLTFFARRMILSLTLVFW